MATTTAEDSMGDTLAYEALDGGDQLAGWEGNARGCSNADDAVSEGEGEGESESENEGEAEEGDIHDAELASAAASAIQSAWTASRSRLTKEQGATPSSSGGPTERVLTARLEDSERRDQSCCISCFQLMPSRPAAPPQDQSNAEGAIHAEPELLCAVCISRLASRQRSRAGPHAGACGSSPLPKLSLLVQAEAKCQDQLQLLRNQQELLRQREEELQATKRAKAQQLAAERELARQRRKHFLLVQERRRREEELKFQQFQAGEDTSRSEQEAPGVQSDKAKRSRQKRKKVPMAENPSRLRKTVEPTSSTSSSLSLPHLVGSTPRTAALRHPPLNSSSDAKAASVAAEAHSKSLWERRRQTLACYSQDLSPLINGLKPKRLPFPKSTTPASNATKRRLTPGSTTNQSLKPRKVGKSAAPKSVKVKLQPLEEQRQSDSLKVKQQNLSNQYDETSERIHYEFTKKHVTAAPLSLQLPKRTLSDQHAPLTAEIKPVSWAYELTKDVEPHAEAHSTMEATGADFLAPLPSVAEEAEADSFSMLQLKHQLPIPTPSATANCSTTPAALADSLTQPPPRWEYSSERLTSLLEKYNVSVSAITAPPKL